MFDIGFMELVLIGIVSLIVVGPERLPGAVRTASLWIGRAKRSFHQVKTEIEREINADEIRRQLHNESILADLDKAKKKADNLIKDTRKNLDSINTEVNATLKEAESITQAKAEQHVSPASPAPAPVPFNPASVDEDYQEPPAITPPSAATSEPEQKQQDEPVVDFYNNPGIGTIQLQGGVFRAVPAVADKDQEPKQQ